MISSQSSQLQAIFQLFLSLRAVAEECLAQNLSEMDVKTFARIKKVIWDQLLATKVEILQS